MATARFADIVAATELGPGIRLLDLVSAEPLAFTGGQYLIVDSGLVLPNGKAVKRAYSILTADRDQHRFRLAVKRIGPGSSFLHEAAPGATIKFSGPWGKMLPADDRPGPALVLATDTGITAALGLVQGQRFQRLAEGATILWLRTDPGYFLPDALVRELAPASIDVLPPIDHPERIPWVRGLVRPILERGVGQAFIAGDGAVNYALLDDLVAAGVPATRDSVESFFNMPKKAAA